MQDIPRTFKRTQRTAAPSFPFSHPIHSLLKSLSSRSSSTLDRSSSPSSSTSDGQDTISGVNVSGLQEDVPNSLDRGRAGYMWQYDEKERNWTGVFCLLDDAKFSVYDAGSLVFKANRTFSFKSNALVSISRSDCMFSTSIDDHDNTQFEIITNEFKLLFQVKQKDDVEYWASGWKALHGEPMVHMREDNDSCDVIDKVDEECPYCKVFLRELAYYDQCLLKSLADHGNK